MGAETDMKAIDWRKYFDQVFVLHYAGYTEVEGRLMSELKRVGLLDSGILTVHNNISSPFLAVLQKNITVDDATPVSSSSFSCSFGHYSIMKIAELKKYERILVLEDDIVFLKDVGAIGRVLDAALSEVPDYDVCMFSHFQSPCVEVPRHIPMYLEEMRAAAEARRVFIPFTSSSAAVASGVAYGLSRRGAVCLRGLYEHQFQIADMIFRNIPYHKDGHIDGFHDEVLSMLRRFYCRIPIGLQNNVENSVTGDILKGGFKKIMAAQRKIAELAGINYDMYNFHHDR